jgi:hypothetical protein
MEPKNLLDTTVKTDIIDRINRLTPQSPPLWGKMNVAQMLAHCQAPLGVALGTHQLKGGFLLRLIGPLLKPILCNSKPFKRNIATAPSFVVANKRDFDLEKKQLLDMVYRFSEASIINPDHPIFGKLTAEQWSKGTWKHLDHHLQQFGV